MKFPIKGCHLQGKKFEKISESTYSPPNNRDRLVCILKCSYFTCFVPGESYYFVF